jgi:hypothetical protein
MRCPKCGQEIDYLRNYQPGTIYYTVELDGNGRPNYIREDVFPDDSTDGSYECPECCTELASSETEAVAFLKGEPSEEMAEYYMRLAIEGGEE